MSILGPPSMAGLLSRRSLITAGSVGVVCATADSKARETTERTSKGGNALEEHMAIEQLLYRYAMALDDLDPLAWAECWVPEMRHITDQVLEAHRQYKHTMHNVLNHSYSIEGATATGATYCIVSLVKDTDGRLTRINTYAKYRDVLVKQDDHWRFRDRQWQPMFSDEETPVVKETLEQWVDRYLKPKRPDRTSP